MPTKHTWKHIPGDKNNWNDRPHQGLSSSKDNFVVSKEIKDLLSADGFRAEGVKRIESLGARSKLVEIEGRKYVMITGNNNLPEKNHGHKDLKALYGATLKGYKLIHNAILDLYAPEKPPYELKIPKIYYYKHTEEKEIVLQEYIEDAFPIGDVNNHNPHVTPPQRKIVKSFREDWNTILNKLRREVLATEVGDYIPNHHTMKVKMPYGEVLLLDDASGGYDPYTSSPFPFNELNILCSFKNEKPTIYLVDALMSLNILPEGVSKTTSPTST